MAKNGVVVGLKQLLTKLEDFGEEGQERIAATTEANAREIEANAKILAPKDTGKLAQSIRYLEIDRLNWKVQANATGIAPYAPYMEFGTGGMVDVPDELKDVAIKFKGKGVRRIDLRPQPYLYPSFVKGRKQYLSDLEEDLKDLSKKV